MIQFRPILRQIVNQNSYIGHVLQCTTLSLENESVRRKKRICFDLSLSVTCIC